MEWGTSNKVLGLPVSSTDCSMRLHMRLLSGFTLKYFLETKILSLNHTCYFSSKQHYTHKQTISTHTHILHTLQHHQQYIVEVSAVSVCSKQTKDLCKQLFCYQLNITVRGSMMQSESLELLFLQTFQVAFKMFFFLGKGRKLLSQTSLDRTLTIYSCYQATVKKVFVVSESVHVVFVTLKFPSPRKTLAVRSSSVSGGMIRPVWVHQRCTSMMIKLIQD